MLHLNMSLTIAFTVEHSAQEISFLDTKVCIQNPFHFDDSLHFSYR